MTKSETQKELEALYSKNQTIPRITQEFRDSKEFNFKQYFKQIGIDEAFGFALMVQMALHKRCDLPTLVGLLRGYFKSSQECVDQILIAAMADLMDWDETLNIFICRVTVSQEVQDDLDRFQFPLPMVVKPKLIKNNRQSGYLLNNSSVILRDNHHEDDVCLDHLNRMNAMKLCVNLDTALMIKNKWKGLDKAKPGEPKEEFNKRKRAFAKYDRTARDVIDILIAEGNEFYLTHRCDKRGRTYCQGYHVSYQGAAWNKACVEFSDKEVVL